MGAQCVLVTIKAQKGKQCVREDRDVYLREIWLLHKDGPMPTGAHALYTFSEDGACMAAAVDPLGGLEGVTISVPCRYNPWFSATAKEFKDLQGQIARSAQPRRPKKRPASRGSGSDSTSAEDRASRQKASSSTTSSTTTSSSSSEDSQKVCLPACNPRHPCCVGARVRTYRCVCIGEQQVRSLPRKGFLMSQHPCLASTAM